MVSSLPLNETHSAGDSGHAAAHNDLTHYANLAYNNVTPQAGVLVPPGWGSFWRAARGNAGSSLAKIAVLGDSLCGGMYASNLKTKSWIGLLKASLQTAYGDGGSGFDGTWHAQPILHTVVGNTTAETYYAGVSGNTWSTTGTWTQDSNIAGPGRYLLDGKSASGTVTASFSGSSFTLWFATGADGCTYTIDGGATHTVTADSTYNIRTSTVTGLGAGSHTVVVTNPYTNSEGIYLSGMTGKNTTGVVVDNFSIPGATSGWWSNLFGSPYDGVWAGGFQYGAPDLCLVEVALNDANTNITADAWAENIQTYLDGVLDTTYGGSATGTTDILFVRPHVGKWDQAHHLWSQYAARLYGLARQYNAAVVDFTALGRGSWNYWNSLNYWSNSASPGTAGTDQVHPSDAGHAYMSSVVLPILQS